MTNRNCFIENKQMISIKVGKSGCTLSGLIYGANVTGWADGGRFASGRARRVHLGHMKREPAMGKET